MKPGKKEKKIFLLLLLLLLLLSLFLFQTTGDKNPNSQGFSTIFSSSLLFFLFPLFSVFSFFSLSLSLSLSFFLCHVVGKFKRRGEKPAAAASVQPWLQKRRTTTHTHTPNKKRSSETSSNRETRFKTRQPIFSRERETYICTCVCLLGKGFKSIELQLQSFALFVWVFIHRMRGGRSECFQQVIDHRFNE